MPKGKTIAPRQNATYVWRLCVTCQQRFPVRKQNRNKQRVCNACKEQRYGHQ